MGMTAKAFQQLLVLKKGGHCTSYGSCQTQYSRGSSMVSADSEYFAMQKSWCLMDYTNR
ncbi:protein of unknown function [Methylocella tundrae]|uniref:Uncharacterized protein n=1 Tax=Methylocella tundrae TaxID=227605 RepID=A0A4V6IN10_METTU|nr:protein of unknown function [Methylocella tundrae]